MRCRYCEHDEREDLVIVIPSCHYECADPTFCDLRAVARGLELGWHLEDVR